MPIHVYDHLRSRISAPPCGAEADLGHERVTCSDNEGHDPPHWTEWGAWPWCALCGGLDEHSATCPEPDVVEGAFVPAFVEWEDGGKPWVGTQDGLRRRRERREQTDRLRTTASDEKGCTHEVPTAD